MKIAYAHQMEKMDQKVIREYGIPGIVLMENAGRGAAVLTREHFGNIQGQKVAVISCIGNNGGDGFIIAGLANTSGIEVELFVAGYLSSISGDAKTALDYALSTGLNVIHAHEFSQLIKKQDASKNSKADETLIVDALLGTGLSGEVRNPFKQLINDINDSPLPVLAVDIPSGLCSDTGKVLGTAVKADLTITFIGRKIGLVTNSGTQHVGKLLFDDLKVPADVYTKVPVSKSM